MSKRVAASLIICVALLTQIGVSLWGAAAARDGVTLCNRDTLVSAMAPGRPADHPTNAPASHDHAACSLCQLGFSFISGEAPYFVVETLAYQHRVALVEPDVWAQRAIFNRSAPARAPPSHV